MPLLPLDVLQKTLTSLLQIFKNSTITDIYSDAGQKELIFICKKKSKKNALVFVLDEYSPCLFEDTSRFEKKLCPIGLTELIHSEIKDMYISEHSHTIVIRFHNHISSLVIELFNKPKYYLTHDHIPENKDVHKNETFEFKDIQSWYEFQKFTKKKSDCYQSLKKQRAKLERQKKNLENQLRDTTKKDEYLFRGELLKANYRLLKKGMSEIEVENYYDENKKILIPLDINLSPKEQIEFFFRKAKKLENAKMPLKKAICKTDEQLCKLSLKFDALNHYTDLKSLDDFVKPEKQKKLQQTHSPYHTFISSSNKEIQVGKSQKDNDILTFQLANGCDHWLHVKDATGSHVIIKSKKNEILDQKTLEEAIQLALYFSKARKNPKAKYEVLVTLKKYVRRFGKVTGKAIVSQEKIFLRELNLDLISELKQRCPV